MEINEISDLENKKEKLNAIMTSAIKENASIGYLNILSPSELEVYCNDLQNNLDKKNKKLFIVKIKKNIVASVILSFCQKENARHRAEIEKLIVHSAYQGLGIATKLMNHVENIAKEKKISLLVLDTKYKDDASYLYEKLEYKKAGQIPSFTLNLDGTYSDTVMYYKSL